MFIFVGEVSASLCEKRAIRKNCDNLCNYVVSCVQSSNGIRIFAGASASTGTEAEAELYRTSAEIFCPSVVAEAPGIAVASVDTGAPFNTGSPVVPYVFFNRSSYKTEDLDSTGAPF